MKNKRTIFLSIILFLLVVLLIIPLANYYVCSLFNQQAEVRTALFWLEIKIKNEPDNFTIFCLMFPVIFSLGIVELLVSFLKKTLLGKKRFGLIILSLLFVGFLIFKLFYIAIHSAISVADSEFNKSLHVFGIDFPVNIFITILIIFLFFIYANKITRRIKEYIN